MRHSSKYFELDKDAGSNSSVVKLFSTFAAFAVIVITLAVIARVTWNGPLNFERSRATEYALKRLPLVNGERPSFGSIEYVKYVGTDSISIYHCGVHQFKVTDYKGISGNDKMVELGFVHGYERLSKDYYKTFLIRIFD